jgi:hypothetical protein
MATRGSKTPKIQPHPLVEALNPNPADPPRATVKLLGLPGASTSGDHTRLWLDGDLTSYVDIPDEDILHSKTLPDDAGTVLWVAAEAQLSYGSVSSHATQAGFLAGSITATHLAGTGSAGMTTGPLTTPTVTMFPPCPPPFPSATICLSTTIICPSEFRTPSHCLPCGDPTHPPVSLPFCPTETCPPSRLGPCITHPPACPLLSQIVVCQPSHAFPCHVTQTPLCQPTIGPCPSVVVICPTPTVHVSQGPQCTPTHGDCPSVNVICPTPTALNRCPSSSCPSHLCVSTVVPCPSVVEVCPSRASCPPQSAACGGFGGGFGSAE